MFLEKLKSDLPASIVVFLVALPLCLGVALASGAPLLSGIISGVIGGIVVGLISQSHTSVSGPAAGLAAVVLSSIQMLGSFDVFLIALILAGAMQLILGLSRAGVIANYFPNNVVKGLLAAIGFILILKQIPHAIGYDKDVEDDFTFFQADGENTFTELISALDYITPGALVVSLLSIALMLFWDKTPLKKLKFLPVSLVVVVLGAALNALFQSAFPYFEIFPTHLVAIPKVDQSNLVQQIHLPDLNVLRNGAVWQVAFTLAIVASLETLLNLEAVDNIDPQKRKSPPNRELLAQGIGNMAAGFFGGIPVTSVIVRSSVNIQARNATKLSAILHGVFMLISVLLLSSVMNLIPLASLASILILTGYKLVNLKLIKAMYAKGVQQFLPFIITVVAIVFTDLLVGVIIGLLASIFFLLRSNFKNPFEQAKNKLHIGEVVSIQLPNQVSFFNKASIKETLWALPSGTKVIVDASQASFIDADVIEVLEDFKNVVAPSREIQVNILGMKDQEGLSSTIQFANVIDKETQQRLQPAQVLELLKEGNNRFVSGQSTDKYHLQQVNFTSGGQNPMAVLVGCIDSRTSPEILFDAGIGDLLTVRIAGNIVSPEVIGSLEIAVKKLGARLIVVKGHSSCGAVALALANVMEDHMHTVTSKIQEVASQCGCYPKNEALSDEEAMEKVSKHNAIHSAEEILQQSDYLRQQVADKKLGIISAYHDISTGRVHFDALK